MQEKKNIVYSCSKTPNPTQQQPAYYRKVEKYMLITKIGEGQFGKVYKSINQETDLEVAIKVVPSQMLTKNTKLNNFVSNEVSILT